jgi:hypothetical protein
MKFLPFGVSGLDRIDNLLLAKIVFTSIIERVKAAHAGFMQQERHLRGSVTDS